MKSSLLDIAQSTSGVLDGTDATITSILTDSRSLTSPHHTLFVALETASGNGHDYISSLYNAGVRAFIVSRNRSLLPPIPDASLIIVDNTLDALQKLAIRKKGNIDKVIAITGSRGKTDMKEWLYILLSDPKTSVARSPRSFNSQIGVPLSMLQIKPATDIAIIEAGISAPGEMQPLTNIIAPDLAVFTTIDNDHDEGFSSRMQKAREKAILATHPNVSTIFYNADSPEFQEIFSNKSQWQGKKIIAWHTNEYDFSSLPIYTPTDKANAAGCIAIMRYLNIPEKDIRNRLSKLSPVDTRLNVWEGLHGCSIIYDGYTSDLPSLIPALDFMRRRASDSQSHTLILSDFEEHSPDSAYSQLANLLQNQKITRFIGVGPEMCRHAALFPPSSQFFPSTKQLWATMSTGDFSNEIILVKGTPDAGLRTIAERLEARTHETLLEVNLDALAANLRRFRERLPHGTKITTMVKANAYGLGSFEVARTMQEQGADYLAVAVLDEGIELRRQGIHMPIMVMNPKVLDYKAIFLYRLEPEIYTLEMLADVINEAKKYRVSNYPVHIKLDTGMHRTGFINSELGEVAKMLNSQTEIKVASIFSHLATADCLDMDKYTLDQIHLFTQMTNTLSNALPYPFMRHILNSAGMVRFPQYAFDMGRLGIGLYGINTLPQPIENDLQTVAALRTIIISIRHWQPGQAIGYGRKGLITRPAKIATIPIGYADGMNRHFGNGAIKVLINGKEAPTIGNICMDACMIDVTDIECKVGDSVEIFGPEMPVERLAQTLNTIPYEILTSISPRVKRVYFRQ